MSEKGNGGEVQQEKVSENLNLPKRQTER